MGDDGEGATLPAPALGQDATPSTPQGSHTLSSTLASSSPRGGALGAAPTTAGAGVVPRSASMPRPPSAHAPPHALPASASLSRLGASAAAAAAGMGLSGPARGASPTGALGLQAYRLSTYLEEGEGASGVVPSGGGLRSSAPLIAPRSRGKVEHRRAAGSRGAMRFSRAAP